LTDDRVALIKRIKEANDIVDVVGSYVALRPAGPTFKGLCPFHQDHRPSFDVDPRRQRYRCWACGKRGDAISFIMEHDRVDFREALELLARRAGISLEKTGNSPQNHGRAAMFELMQWAAGQYHQCVLDSPLAEMARTYLGERRLTGETVRRYGLGFAPPAGSWLLARATQAGLPVDTLEKLGLFGRRSESQGYYDRFRDRIVFPIRDVQGRTVGFGGRILPGSAWAAKAPKYYNSADTPLFTKSEHLYGLETAKQSAAAAGYLAVVEGYTDVLMAHQAGVPQVVSTMGTALNARHVKNLVRWAPRVVLVFDADAGGSTGVDRALEIFVSQDVDLAIATLPEGLDPFDLIVQQGPEPFRQALANAVDALEFKLSQVLAGEASTGVEGRRRAVEAVLTIIARAPELTDQKMAVKQQLIVTRIAHQLGLREEIVRARLRELRRQRESSQRPTHSDTPAGKRAAPAAPREKQLLQVLLANPALVPVATAAISVEELEHPGIRQLVAGLYALQARGERPELDRLRDEITNPALAETALRYEEIGRLHAEPAVYLQGLVNEFRKQRLDRDKQELQSQLLAASDHTEAVELLRQLQVRTVASGSGTPSVGASELERGGF
jgi:DNA primase